MKIKTKENLNALFYFAVLFVLTFGTIVFDIGNSSTWQVIWTLIFFGGLVTFFVFTVLKMKDCKSISDTHIILIVCSFVLMSWIVLMCQFYELVNLWVKLRITFLTSLLGGIIYQFLRWGVYLRLFFRDRILRLFATVALFITVFGLVYFLVDQISFVLKIGLGIDFLLLVYAIINAIFYNENKYFKPEDRQTFVYKLITISLYAIAIFLFPYYLRWCGLDEQSFNIFIPVYAYVVGGMLTLGGVAWTIRKSEIDKRMDDIKRSKPVAFIFDKETLIDLGEKPIERTMLSKRMLGTLVKALNNEKAYILPEMIISNSDYSHVAVKGFKINDDFHLFDLIQVLPKNTTVKLKNDFRFRYDNEIRHVSILMQDMMDNDYELEVNFEVIDGRLDVKIEILSALKTKMIELPRIDRKKN